MIRFPANSVKSTALQFWRRVFRGAYSTEEACRSRRNLKGIAIDENACCLVRHEKAGVIQITDHASRCVYARHRSGDIVCSAYQKGEICSGKFDLPTCWRKQKVRLVPADFLHHEADKSPPAPNGPAFPSCSDLPIRRKPQRTPAIGSNEQMFGAK